MRPSWNFKGDWYCPGWLAYSEGGLKKGASCFQPVFVSAAEQTPARCRMVRATKKRKRPKGYGSSHRREEADCCAHIEFRLPMNGSGARTFLSAAACSVQGAGQIGAPRSFVSCCGQECPRAAKYGCTKFIGRMPLFFSAPSLLTSAATDFGSSC